MSFVCLFRRRPKRELTELLLILGRCGHRHLRNVPLLNLVVGCGTHRPLDFSSISFFIPGRGGEIVPEPRRLLHKLFVNLAGDAIGCDRAVVEGYFGNSIIVAAVAVEE